LNRARNFAAFVATMRRPDIARRSSADYMLLMVVLEQAHELGLNEPTPPDARSEADWKVELERRARRVLEEGSRGAPWAEVRAEIERELKR